MSAGINIANDPLRSSLSRIKVPVYPSTNSKNSHSLPLLSAAHPPPSPFQKCQYMTYPWQACWQGVLWSDLHDSCQNTTAKNRVREIAGSRLGSNFIYLMDFARTRVLRETYWEHGRVPLIGYVLGNEVSGM
jgi:hypothetical protein